MLMHFEELWEKAEQYHKTASVGDHAEVILEELLLKIGLYKAIAQRSEIAEADKKEAKSRLMGEILLTLSNLSLQEDVNVFEALKNALVQHSIEHYSKTYSD